MAFSVSPSVTVNEIDTTGSIPAVVNSPAAIAGVFAWGPVNEPVLITSEDELVSRFGKPSDLNAETFFTAADFLSYSNAIYVTRVSDVNTVATSVSSPFEAKYPGVIGNELTVSYTSKDAYYDHMYNGGQMFGTVAFSSKIIPLELISPIMPNLVVGDIIEYGSNPTGFHRNEVVSISNLGQDPITNRYKYNIGLKNPYTHKIVNLANIAMRRYWKYFSLFNAEPKTNNDFHAVVIDRTGKISGVAGTVLEKYENLSLLTTAKDANGATTYYKNVIDGYSNWIRTTLVTPGASDAKYRNLAGGVDSSNESTIALEFLASGYDNYSNAEEIDVSFVLQGKAIGGTNKTDLANYILSNIVEVRKDCMVFISPSYETSVSPLTPEDKMAALIGFRENVLSSSYWFMDTGYKYRYDKYNDVYRWIPMNGDMGGLAARVDPWVSPAGYQKGVIKNAAKLAYNPNKSHRDILYGSDINPVISVTGKGILLFGDKTGLGTTSAFDRINVRRLFITIEKAIANMAQNYLFEINDIFTQLRFKNTIVPYLANIQGQRGIIDFKVVTDQTINTPDAVDRNEFHCNIFVKPARSINFINLNFIAVRSGVAFEEVIF